MSAELMIAGPRREFSSSDVTYTTSMLKCKELSRLPKAASGKFVNFRRQTPGSTTEHFRIGNTPPSDCLDPSHPARNVPKNIFPNIRSDVLGIKAVPFAALSKPEHIWTTPASSSFDTWTERAKRLLNTNANLKSGEEPLQVAPILLNNVKENGIPMSFINATSKKRTSNKKHVRGKIASRLKVAINLIVTRGADVAEVNGKPQLVMNDEEAEKMSDKWVSPGWTYIFFPTLDIYRMPYHEMIPLLRKSLQRLYELSQNFEKRWADNLMNPRKAPHTQHSIPNRAQAFRQHAFGKTASRKPSQQNTPKHLPSRRYSTRTISTKSSFVASRKHENNIEEYHQFDETESLKFRSRANRLNNMATSAPGRETLKPEEDIAAVRSDPTTRPEAMPTIRLGDVVFKRIPGDGRMLNNDILKIIPEDDPSIKILREVRDDVTTVFGKSNMLYASKRFRQSRKCSVAAREAKRGNRLSPEFIGFDSRPNPSYNPFTDAESDSRPQEGPTPARKTLLDLLNKRSARMSPRDSERRVPDEVASPASSDFPSELSRVDLSTPDDFDPFAPLLHADEKAQSPASVVLNNSADKKVTRSYDPLDFENSAASEPPHTPSLPSFKCEPEVPLRSVSPSETRSMEDLIQAFDPFSPKDFDGFLIGTTAIPVSQHASESSSRLSTSTEDRTKERPAEAIRKAFTSETSRMESTRSRKNDPHVVSWRMFRSRSRSLP